MDQEEIMAINTHVLKKSFKIYKANIEFKKKIVNFRIIDGYVNISLS